MNLIHIRWCVLREVSVGAMAGNSLSTVFGCYAANLISVKLSGKGRNEDQGSH